jgi:hypothetical protein
MADWTKDRINELTELWNGRYMSSADIARRMHLSRNAVIGKAHRLHLPNKAPTRIKAKPKPKPKKIKMDKKPVSPMPLPVPEVSVAPVEYLKLRSFHCRAIVDGIGSDGLVLSCGRQHVWGSSYCAKHLRQYHQYHSNYDRRSV